MINSPMVGEVNTLVGNLLLANQTIFLPGVGSLMVVRNSARKLSKRLVAPPSRAVEFHSQENGISLVREIAREAACPDAQAQIIYDSWMARITEGDTRTIDGVGVLVQKSFTPDPAFAVMLNPQGAEPVRLKKRVRWGVWVTLLILLLMGGGGAAFFYFMPMKPLAPQPIVKTLVALAQPVVVVPDTVAMADTCSVVATENVPIAVVQEMQVGRYYVVLGVFSVEKTAIAAMEQFCQTLSTAQAHVYSYGRRFMVSIYEADTAEGCEAFVQSQRKNNPDLWIYKDR